MGAPRFHVRDPLAAGLVGSEIALPDGVAHHALRVLRLSTGDVITLFDGRGGEYAATLVRAGKRDAWARVEAFDPVDRESPLRATLVQAITATDTMDAIVRHAVELGVASIEPVVTERSARFPSGAHGDKRLAHWREVAVSACEQCGRNRIPGVAAPAVLSEWLRAPRTGIVFDAGAADGLPRSAPAGPFHVLVGAEGGLTAREIELAVGAGLRAVRAGPRIMRAETAALCALAAVNVSWGDFR
ncbi:MAG: 16S rRNA (uracil(1498)-N(3))-methyltransferase [Burkholderiales bacterium]